MKDIVSSSTTKSVAGDIEIIRKYLSICSDILRFLCSCTENFSGDRCEIVDAIESTSHKSCDRLLFADDAEYSEVFIALISTSVLCVILIIAVIILSFRVWRLSSSRSRFKRRIIRQAKHRRPAERVINIEDCCNMNICETVRYWLT